ncbi:MAG: hypothetical protein M3463_00565 [Verrucomicrobiota bacterium]|nr:hypothetical protein [Verrucomicrobiota bacterium]
MSHLSVLILCFGLCIALRVGSAAEDSKLHPHPTTLTLRRFLDAVARTDYSAAFDLIAESAKTNGDVTLRNGALTLKRFTGELAVDQQRMATLKLQIAANRQKPPEASPSVSALSTVIPPEEQELAGLESKLQRTQKCADYQFGELSVVSAGRVEVPVRTQVRDGIQDNDIAILVQESGAWLLANPLHIVR